MNASLSESLVIRRSGSYLRPDNSRVLLRPFLPGGEERARRVIGRILELSEARIDEQHALVIHLCEGGQSGPGRERLEQIFEKRFEQLKHLTPDATVLSEKRRRVIGAFFLSEYSLQSAALFNPSIVASPTRSGANEGELPFIMSLRATGEGHVSSIEFRAGVITGGGDVNFDPVSPFVTHPDTSHPVFEKREFQTTLLEVGFERAFVDSFLSMLGETFEMAELEETMKHPERWPCPLGMDVLLCEENRESALHKIRWAAQCDYVIRFSSKQPISERIIFPASPSEQGGIEDARFVRFREDDGWSSYYATYTAYDGNNVLPQLIETEDFVRFRLHPLHGSAVRNKGMALFPRRINGKYAMLGRQGGENITLMLSNDIRYWNSWQVIMEPESPWEFVQIGNCGSPIETSAGWLVLTHGVGAMRNYCIGAALLDLDDPAKVIGRLREPLLEPLENERDGYVPNVVYTCGAIVHNGWLVIPYAVSDYAITTATVSLDALLERLSHSQSFRP